MLKATRPTKSFRDAGDRIVRQERELVHLSVPLLGASVGVPRSSMSDGEAWDVRIAALVSLGQFEAVTFAGRAERLLPSHNVGADVVEDAAISGAVDRSLRSAAPVQIRAAVPLADGRVATSVLVTPLPAPDGPRGALIALRTGRPFAAVDAHAAVAVAEIVALELRRAAAAAREDTQRREALALYELARHALFAGSLDEALQGVAASLAGLLDHDAVHIWLRQPDGSLRRRAASPADGSASASAHEDDHSALHGALRERRVVRASGSARWMPSRTHQLLVVPLRADPRPVGVLVLARAERPYGPDDIEMGDILGAFLARVVTSTWRVDGAVSRGEGAIATSA